MSQDPVGISLPTTGSDGSITVTLVGPTTTPTVTPTITPTATPTSTPTNTPIRVIIDLGEGIGLPSGNADVTASLTTQGLTVGAGGNDISYDNTLFSVNVGTDCTPSIAGKSISGGLISTVGNLTTVRVYVVGGPINFDPIPDGPLYTCAFHILSSTTPGTYPLLTLNYFAQDPVGVPLPVTGFDGSITVTLVGPTPTPTRTPTATPN